LNAQDKEGERISKKKLVEWTENYIRNRDIITRFVEGMDRNKEGWDIIVHTKSGDKFYAVMPSIESLDEVAKNADGKSVVIVAYNTKKNLDKTIEGWSKLTPFPNLSIMFVNPESALDKKWVIFPHTHDKVTEKASFKRGLRSMFETVDEWKG
jgi:hypothetical protein